MRFPPIPWRHLFAAFFVITLLGGCADAIDNLPSPPTPPGKVNGSITSSASPATTVAGANITLFNAATHTPIATATSNNSGYYEFTLAAGSYYLHIAAQGYDPVPAAGLDAIPFTVINGQVTANNIAMTPASNLNTGWISGNTTVSNSGKSGVLVVASNGAAAFSTLSDQNGNYVIYNVPVAATYSVTGYDAGYTATTASPVIVTQNTATTGVNIALTGNATGQVPVTYNTIAQTGITPPATMTVSLLHPLTHETIPGLVQTLPYAPSISFALGGVADGNYLVRATYANDTIVVDPDAIVKFGEPSVAVSSGNATPNPIAIKVTGAVNLLTPSNAVNSTLPVPVVASGLSFSWDAYPSTSDYVVEVMDATTGQVIWGGFTGSGAAMTKVISTTSTTISYGGPALTTGRVYRWRVYASKNDNQLTPPWKLISASEQQRGLIRIQ